MDAQKIKAFIEAVSNAVDNLNIPADRKNIVFEIVIQARLVHEGIEI